MLKSSANSFEKLFKQSGKSLMKITKSSGPKTEQISAEFLFIGQSSSFKEGRN